MSRFERRLRSQYKNFDVLNLDKAWIDVKVDSDFGKKEREWFRYYLSCSSEDFYESLVFRLVQDVKTLK